MYDKCILCDQDPEIIDLNGLPMKKCESCQFLWRQSFHRSGFDYESRNSDLSNRKLVSRTNNTLNRINTFRKFIDLNNLCDIGCGEGVFLDVLSKKGFINIIGIEPNTQAINFARSKGLEVYEGKLDKFPELARNKNIHSVTMLHVIEHLEDPLGSLRIVHGGLDKGNHIILETPDINSFSLKTAGYKHSLICEDHLFYFSERSLKKVLEKAGFRIIAFGKRDFDQYNFGIRESLSRLGLMNRSRQDILSNNDVAAVNAGAKNFVYESNTSHFIKLLLRPVLNRLAILSGRLDFIWVVAERL